MSSIIKVENLGKAYQRGSYGGAAKLTGFWGDRQSARDVSRFWALSEISLNLEQGSVTGVIGRNGAGKSTLLKLLSKITYPTTGRIKIHGRVSCLLEIGTGFHPELSGRENVYLNGAILGMKQKEITSKFEEIVAFSGIEKFIDTPVKRYSSGMYVRLAFAVAAHLDSEILLIDEVLAVGDAEFQKKCIGKMGDVAKGGRTVIFVSHNMKAIQALCDETYLLDSGKLISSGNSAKVINSYLGNSKDSTYKVTWDEFQSAPGSENARFKSVYLDIGNNKQEIDITTSFDIVVIFWNKGGARNLNLAIRLNAITGECIFNSVSECLAFENGLIEGRCKVPGNLLNDGIYTLDIVIAKDASRDLFTLDEVLQFEILDERSGNTWFGEWPGAVRPKLEFGLEMIKPELSE